MAASDWSERTRMIVAVSVGLAINAGLFGWTYMAHDKYKILAAQYKTLQAEKKKKQEIVADLEDLKRKLADLRVELDSKERKLPEADDVAKLIEEMDKIATETKSHLKTSTEVHGGAVEGSDYERNTWQTTWSSDFFGWMRLVHRMEEKFPRLVSFENMRLTPPANGVVSTGAQEEISVDVVTYTYKRKQ